MLIHERICDLCREHIPKENKYNWNMDLRFANKKILGKDLCQACVMKQFNLDENECRFVEVLLAFRRDNSKSYWEEWDKELKKEFIVVLQTNKIPIENYFVPLYEKYKDVYYMADLKKELGIKSNRDKELEKIKSKTKEEKNETR